MSEPDPEIPDESDPEQEPEPEHTEQPDPVSEPGEGSVGDYPDEPEPSEERDRGIMAKVKNMLGMK